MAPHLQTIHHDGYDPSKFTPFVPALRVTGGTLVFVAGVTAAPTYHDHPHVPEVFDAIPCHIEGQVPLVFEHLAEALDAAGCERSDVVSLTRYFCDVGRDQDIVNRFQGDWFGGHIPTSTTVEVCRLATDPRMLLEVTAIAVSSR